MATPVGERGRRSNATDSAQNTNGTQDAFDENAPASNSLSNSQKPATDPSRPSQDLLSRQRTTSEDGEARQRSRPRDRERRPSAQRFCGKCQLQLTGQFVRALGDTFHLECFTCHDCDKIVASKFFPVPDHPPNQYPLCETDYFRRLDLLCHACEGALRGSYITALDRKYHIEHFTCSVCPTVFGAQDSYYEHESNVYCHYHYSTKFAQRCYGCQTAILKQFVEIFRKGGYQHWHPECYMIHKYWNVRLHASPPQSSEATAEQERQKNEIPPMDDASEEERNMVRKGEEAVEYKVHWIWKTLSSFEERSATSISDMLLHVSNGAYMEGTAAAKKFIVHVDVLFSAADDLDLRLQTRLSKGSEKSARTHEMAVHPGLSYSREAKLLCKKVVAFFNLLAESSQTGVRRVGVTQELLTLVTGLAHYLKLMIRICLSGALKLERETSSAEGLESFLQAIGRLDERVELEAGRDLKADMDLYRARSADTCIVCSKAVEDRCFRRENAVFHTHCLVCVTCGRTLSEDYGEARWSQGSKSVFCAAHAPTDAQQGGFQLVTRLQQLVILLRIAHARLLDTLTTSGALPHTSDDPNLAGYDSHSSRTGNEGPVTLGSTGRSHSYAGRTDSNLQPENNYEDTMGDIRRLRSTRMDRQLSNAGRHARTSRIIDGPEGVRAGSPDHRSKASYDNSHRLTGGFRIVQETDSTEQLSQLSIGGQDAMKLDDIPRIVQAQQTREQRPNASRYARQRINPQEPKPRLINGHTREFSGEELKQGERLAGTKKYFSELTALEYFIVRHVAVLSMEPLLEGHFNQEELLDLIESKRPTFWSKFGKAFQAKEKKTKNSKTAIFGVPLEQLLERDYEESTDGVGPGSLKIPSLVQETVSAMKTMDMSVEGVFRKNGNIKRLNDVKEEIDAKGVVEVDLTKESPVQVAALLKKFLREMPDPLLTHKLHKLWITSQRIEDVERRRRVLHLTCCLLPKAHRDTMEVLFTFMNWVSSFSHVDEDSGSKMDIHNLATVITPNIIHHSKDISPVDDSFLAIEAVHSLIECNESMCEVPEDLAMILNDSSLFSNSADLTSKEILKRYGDRARAPTVASPAVNSAKLDSYGTTPGSASGPQSQNNSSMARSDKPTAHRVDTDPEMQHAWQNESSVRHVGSDIGTPGAVHTSASTPGSLGVGAPLVTPPTIQYGQPRSSGEGSRGGDSPNQTSMRGAAYADKQRAMSIGV